MSPANRAAMVDWFKLRSIPYSKLDENAECLDQFAEGAIDALIVERVYPAAYMEELACKIERHDLPFHVFPSHRPWEQVRPYRHLYGITLAAASPDLSEYFRVASCFREQCRELFKGGADYESCMAEIFGVLGGGKQVSLPCTRDGRIYMPATIRILPPKSGIELHCDNNLGHRPTYSALKTICDVANQLSHFLTIKTPDRGGELVVYRKWWSPADDYANEYVVRKQDSVVDGTECLSIRPNPGDVILFTGGRSYHKVTPSLGGRARLTIGGFIGKALTHEGFYYWS